MFKSLASEIRKGICVLEHTHNRSCRADISGPKLKSQSAMEYLMTYGWAILIIAVVLGALFSLGVFNASNLAPKASPGACQVFRPNGPGTTSFVNLEGECQGLEPQYVAQFGGKASGSSVHLSNVTFGTGLFTVALWFYPTANAIANGGYLIRQTPTTGSNALIIQTSGSEVYYFFSPPFMSGATTISPNIWYLVAMTYNGATVTGYLDAKSVGSAQFNSAGLSFGYVCIGASPAGGTDYCLSGYNNYNGSIANVQIYNTSLSQNDIKVLYQEGIGGAPIDPQNLVGWWPLNGNANDYSGNNNNGQATNVIYTSSWTSGYSAP